MIKSLLRAIYPSTCLSCRLFLHDDSSLCASCLKLIKPLVSRRIPLTPSISLPVYSVGAYQDPLRNLVVGKFSHHMRSSRYLGLLMTQQLPHDVLDVDFLIPVPLHWTRYAGRGYNQALIIAKAMSAELNIPVLRFLVRTKRTSFQFLLSPKQREQNVEDAFEINYWYRFFNSDILRGKRVLLVDDLCTTGSTLKHAARELLKHRPASLAGVVGCRA